MRPTSLRSSGKALLSRVILATLGLAAVSAGTAWPTQEVDSQPKVHITLKPGGAERNNQVADVDVMMTLQAVEAPAGAPLLL